MNSKINQKKSLNTLDVYWKADANLKYTFVSENIYEEFGYTADEWLSIDVSKTKDYQEILKIKDLAIKEAHTNKFLCFESKVKLKNGQVSNVEVTFKASLDEKGLINGFFGSVRNISHRIKIGKKFILNNKVIESKNNNDHDKFILSVISHNLINPFNIILGYSELLKEDYFRYDDFERLNFLDKIHKYSKANYELTKNLLDWAKLQQQGIVVKKEILNCKKLIKKAIEPYMCLAEQKEIKVKICIKEDDKIYLDGDVLKNIIANLFVNSLKYTERNGIVKISLKSLDDNQTRLIVEDNGVGMSQDELNRIFKISSINSKSGTKGEKGTGMGLHICKKLIDYHNGTLNFSSTLNRGTKAILTF